MFILFMLLKFNIDVNNIMTALRPHKELEMSVYLDRPNFDAENCIGGPLAAPRAYGEMWRLLLSCNQRC